MFVDRAVVTFIAGRGGSGCVSFRREKFIPMGGPDGGDGGDGGDVVLTSKSDTHSLVDFKFRNLIRAQNGKNGSGSNRTGKRGESQALTVPAGTVVKSYPDERLMFDFSAGNMELVIARGGGGGRGNTRFKSSVHQAPRRANPGEKGEEIKVVLELKLIAFAGLVGLPNAGKSTLISKVSGAKPKVADYPFTTLTPHLGVVYNDHYSLVLADIPGIISGAHKGEGMGLDFLKHIERNEVLVYLIDLSVGEGLSPSPLESYETLRRELGSYKSSLLNKKSFVVGNKVDLLDINSRSGADELAADCARRSLDFVEISALKERNLEMFKKRLFGFYHEH